MRIDLVLELQRGFVGEKGGRSGKMEVVRDTVYGGKLRRRVRARITVVRDFSDHCVER